MQVSRGQRPVPVTGTLAEGIAVGVLVAVDEPHLFRKRREFLMHRPLQHCHAPGGLFCQAYLFSGPSQQNGGAVRVVAPSLLRDVQGAWVVAQNRPRLMPVLRRAFVRKHHFRQKFASPSEGACSLVWHRHSHLLGVEKIIAGEPFGIHPGRYQGSAGGTP